VGKMTTYSPMMDRTRTQNRLRFRKNYGKPVFSVLNAYKQLQPSALFEFEQRSAKKKSVCCIQNAAYLKTGTIFMESADTVRLIARQARTMSMQVKSRDQKFGGVSVHHR